jgi:hypothetical protein
MWQKTHYDEQSRRAHASRYSASPLLLKPVAVDALVCSALLEGVCFLQPLLAVVKSQRQHGVIKPTFMTASACSQSFFMLLIRLNHKRHTKIVE